MHSTRDSAAIDSDRTEPYVSRGAKDRDPLNKINLIQLKLKRLKKKKNLKPLKNGRKRIVTEQN